MASRLLVKRGRRPIYVSKNSNQASISDIPERPSRFARQKSSTPTPLQAMTPIPVTTTLRLFIAATRRWQRLRVDT